MTNWYPHKITEKYPEGRPAIFHPIGQKNEFSFAKIEGNTAYEELNSNNKPTIIDSEHAIVYAFIKYEGEKRSNLKVFLDQYVIITPHGMIICFSDELEFLDENEERTQ